MENILDKAIIQCIDREDSAGIKDLFQTRPNLDVLLQHIHQTGNYQMLEHLFPFITARWDVSSKATLPICIHLACSGNEQSEKLLKSFMHHIELYPPRLFFNMGEAGVPWDKIAVKNGFEKSYFLGMVTLKCVKRILARCN